MIQTSPVEANCSYKDNFYAETREVKMIFLDYNNHACAPSDTSDNIDEGVVMKRSALLRAALNRPEQSDAKRRSESWKENMVDGKHINV